MQIAVIADPHYHDIKGWPAATGERPALRSLADTIASTRVFNESYGALPAALDQVVRDGISVVVIVGDLTDDGQAATVRSVNALLSEYTSRHGLRFFMTPGNHDLFAIHGRHQSKRFLNADGSTLLVTSNADEPPGPSTGRLVTDEMYCAGYPEGLPALAAYGFFRQPADLHWESPFGPSDALVDRLHDMASNDGETVLQMIDASYLVEPVEGLWLLSLDVNVFEPKDGPLDPTLESSYFGSSDAGWNAMLKHKRFVLDWAADVAERARRAGKHLLTFSHYPMIDPQGDTAEEEKVLFEDSSFARRAPRQATVEAAVKSGLRVHFSGHLHVNGNVVARRGDDFLINIAVPSLVGFPAAYKRVRFHDDRMEVDTVMLDEVPGYDAAFAGYRIEAARGDADGTMLDGVDSHAAFVDAHGRFLAQYRYLPEEWPTDLLALLPMLTTTGLAVLAAEPEPLDAERARHLLSELSPVPPALPFFEVVVDWYRLRKGRELALPYIPDERLALYRQLQIQFARQGRPDGSVQGRLAAFFRLLVAYLDSPPSADFDIDLTTGAIGVGDYFGRTERRQTGSAWK